VAAWEDRENSGDKAWMDQHSIWQSTATPRGVLSVIAGVVEIVRESVVDTSFCDGACGKQEPERS
jgi:hypothetical protein